MIGVGRWRMMFGGSLVIYLVLMVAVTVGMSHGLHADSAADARIDYENVEVSADESSYEYNNPVLPEEFERDNAGSNERVEQFAETVTRKALWIADGVSLWAYQNQSWISPWWAAKLLQTATYGGVLVYFGLVLRRIRDLGREVWS